MKLIDHELRNK